MGRAHTVSYLASVRRYAPSRLVQVLLNRLQKMVSMKVVLMWLIIDIIVSIGLLIFYLVYRDLAALGIMKSRKLWIIGFIRLVILFFGCWVVWNRRHSFGEAFFFTFVVNTLLFSAFLIPVERLLCDCRVGTWHQCHAAQSFTYLCESDRYNPYRPRPTDADDAWQEPGPDSRMQKAQPPDILYVVRPPSKSSLLQETTRRWPKRLQGPQGLFQQNMLMLDVPDQTEPEQTEPDQRSRPDKAEPEQTEPDQTKPDQTKPDQTEPDQTKPDETKPDKAEKDKTEADKTKVDKTKVKDEKGTDSGSLMREACREAFPKGLPEKLTPHDLGLLNNLTVFATLRTLLSEKLLKDMDVGEEQKILEYLHEICDEPAPVLAQMPKKTKTPEVKKLWQKQLLYIKDLLPLKQGEQVQQLHKHFRRTCRCAGASSCNWFNYGAHMTMWCYVEESSVPWCHVEGIQLFKDTNNKTWTVDLCGEGSCQCARLGMPPPDEDNPEEDHPLLQKNSIYYGSKCGKWREDDSLSWCWVGMDTTCFNRDRPPAPDYKHTDFPKGLQYMFRSVEPCASNHLHQNAGGRLEDAMATCEYIQVSLEIFMYVFLICMFPMGSIIFKFVCNRCGDTIETEDQFQAYETSESEDEPPPRHDSFTAFRAEGAQAQG